MSAYILFSETKCKKDEIQKTTSTTHPSEAYIYCSKTILIK